MKLAIAVLVLAGSASAQPTQKPVPVEFDAEVLALRDPPPPIHCGIFMATQDMEIRVTKVISGPIKTGRTTLTVMTCFGGHLMRELPNGDGTFEIDPDKMRGKSRIHVVGEDIVPPKGKWFTTDPQIAVTKL
jgi:hypothetical protein